MRCVMIAVLALQATAHADGAWQEIGKYDDLTVSVRPAVGTSLREVQVHAQSTLSPTAIFRVIWDVGAQRDFVPHVRDLLVLKNTADEIIFYERLRVPIVHDRDYVLRLTRTIDGQRYELAADGANDLGPPPPRGVVRVTHLWTRIIVAPLANGGSDVWYTSFADPAGSVPAWLVRTADERGPRDFVRAILKRAAELH